MKIFFTTITLLISNLVLAQTNIWLNHYDNYLIDREVNKLDVDFHTGFKPYRPQAVEKAINIPLDSIDAIEPYNWNFATNTLVGRKLFNENTIQAEKEDFKIIINPIFNFQIGRDFSKNINTYTNTRGFNAFGQIGSKFTFSTSFFENQSRFPGYVNDYVKANRVVPGQGRYKIFKTDGFDYAYALGSISFTPNKYFNFQFGNDKNFIGDGYRSLLLSDNAFNYPFLKITTNVWIFQYTNLYTQLQDISPSAKGDNLHLKKYSSSHYLSTKLGKRLELGIFETVIWDAGDTTNHRGFDITYLNPVIFYRPVEYSLGSPDNVLLGLNFKVKVNNYNQFYGQILLDEFYLKHIKTMDGWHANKQGFQFGFKSFDIFNIKNLAFQTEFNYVRPYTYSHYRPMQSYTHYNQALAHPLGANFMENISFVRYKYQRWTLEAKTMYAIVGLDENQLNYGNNIFVSYYTYAKEYNNYVGQGLKTTITNTELRLGYLINPKIGMRLEVTGGLRTFKNNLQNTNNKYFAIALRTNLPNYYYDF